MTTKAIANEAVVGSLDVLRKHLMDKTVCLAVFPKKAFPEARITGLRARLANENTWNCFLTKEQLTKLVMGKYFCPVVEYATADNWCIFVEQRRLEIQYKKLTKFIATEYDLSPQPVDHEGQPIYEPGELRYKFTFCKKFHMIVLDGVERKKLSGSVSKAVKPKLLEEVDTQSAGDEEDENENRDDEDGNEDGSEDENEDEDWEDDEASEDWEENEDDIFPHDEEV